MISLSFYRSYIATYIFLLNVLIIIGFIIDMVFFNNNLSKTITSILIFIFSYISLTLKHFWLEKSLNLKNLHLNSILWRNEFLKYRYKSKKLYKLMLIFLKFFLVFPGNDISTETERYKSPRDFKKRKLIIYQILSLVLLFFPFIIGEVCFYLGVSNFFYSREFAIIGILLRNIVLFLTMFMRWTKIFGNKQKYLELN